MKKIVDSEKKKDKDHGFTLIELLAVIAILSLVIGLVIYFSIAIFKSAKEKSYEVTINEIEDEANNYVLEELSTVSWVDSADGSYEYQCVTVQNLIDTGYFKGDVLESYVAEDVHVRADDYIYLERDKNSNTITKSILLIDGVDESYFELCDKIKAGGNISFLVEPVEWSREKDVTIKYDIYNNIDRVSNYKYNYSFNDIYVEDRFDSLSMVKKVTVTSNGTMYATINDNNGFSVSSSINITKIDRTGPVISSDYSGDGVVSHSVVIPIKLKDSQSGVDNDSFTLSDLVVTIGDKVITDGVTLDKVKNNNYQLTIVNDVDVGEVKITIDKGKVLDLVVDKEKNGNEKTVLVPGVIFNNVHLIKYNSNGGIGTMSNTECSYGDKCTLRKNTFTKSGYTFKGWSSSSSSSSVLYEDEETITYNTTSDTVLYAVWTINKVYIKYNVNGGTITSTTNSSDNKVTYNWKQDSSGLIYLNNNVLKYSINYGSSLGSDGLANWDNEHYMEVTKIGHSAKTGAEWKCLSGCTTSGTTFADNKAYAAEDFCDVSKGDCTVELGVNWNVNTYTLTYDANGGSGAPDAEKVSYGSSVTVTSTTPVKKNSDKLYCVFLGWNTKADGTGTSYESGNGLKITSNVTLYAQWHCHTWKARGIQIYEPSNWSNAESFTCGYKHCKAFLIYCSVCGMSKAYYKKYVSPADERSNVTYTMNCPCNAGGFSVYYDDSDLTLNEARKMGGIYYGGTKLDTTTLSNSEKDCSEHTETVTKCNLE